MAYYIINFVYWTGLNAFWIIRWQRLPDCFEMQAGIIQDSGNCLSIEVWADGGGKAALVYLLKLMLRYR